MQKNIYIDNKKCNLTNWMPSKNDKELEINSNSWFDIRQQTNPDPFPVPIRAHKIKLEPNDQQKSILANLFELYKLVYDWTIDNINKKIHVDKVEKDDIKFNELMIEFVHNIPTELENKMKFLLSNQIKNVNTLIQLLNDNINNKNDIINNENDDLLIAIHVITESIQYAFF